MYQLVASSFFNQPNLSNYLVDPGHVVVLHDLDLDGWHAGFDLESLLSSNECRVHNVLRAGQADAAQTNVVHRDVDCVAGVPAVDDKRSFDARPGDNLNVLDVLDVLVGIMS